MTTSALPSSVLDAHTLVAQRAARWRTTLCTAPIVNHASALLEAWAIAASRRNTDLTRGAGPDWAARLADVALEIAADGVRELRPRTPDAAMTLLDAAVAELADRDTITARDSLYVPLPRTSATPAWGAFGPRPLAITIDIDRGWALVIDQPQGSRPVYVIARYDHVGVDCVVDLALEVNAGAHGNIFI